MFRFISGSDPGARYIGVCFAAAIATQAGCATAGPQEALPGNSAFCKAAVVETLADSTRMPINEARLREVRLPPEPPPHLRGEFIAIQVVVNEMGLVDPSSIAISGAGDDQYNAVLVEHVQRLRFAAARRDGCSVPSLYLLRYTF